MEERIYDKRAIRKEIYLLIIPIILESVFQMSAGLVSAAMIGRLTASVISAQGIGNRVTGILYCLFRGIGIGATVIIARSYGEGERNKCRDTFEQTAVTGVIISVLAIAGVLMCSKGIISFFTDSSVTASLADEYLSIVIMGSPFLLIMSVVTGAFQGHSNTKTPMYIAIFVNIINIVLGYVLIYGKFGMPRLELKGAAIALATAQMSGALLGIYMLYNRRNGLFAGYASRQKPFRVHIPLVKEVYSVGIPAAFESMFWQLSAVIMSKIILSYGEVTFAAYQLGLQAEGLTEMPATGLGVAATALSARAVGERDDRLFKVYTGQIARTTVSVSICTSLMLILLPNVFMRLFTNDTAIQAIGATYVIAMGFIQLPQNMSKVFNGIMRSAGYKNIPMVISFAGIWVFRVPMSLLFAYVFRLDIVFIWMCMATDQVMKCVLSLTVFRLRKVNDVVSRMVAAEARN